MALPSLSELLKKLLDMRGSDLHITTNSPPQVRVHGSLMPLDMPQQCSTMNGNCVLIPRKVRELVGELDAAFVHGAGDFDYGLRAASRGCSIWIAPGVLGECRVNGNTRPWLAAGLSLTERFRYVASPKGLPFKPWLVFTKRHMGLLWPVYWGYPYLKLIANHLLKSVPFRRARQSAQR